MFFCLDGRGGGNFFMLFVDNWFGWYVWFCCFMDVWSFVGGIV